MLRQKHGLDASGRLSSRWRWVVLLLAFTFLLIGLGNVVGSVVLDRGGSAVFGVLVGLFVAALGLFGLWRGAFLGVRWSPDGIEVRKLDGTTRHAWVDVEAVDVRVRRHDLLHVVRHVDVVLVLASGDEDWIAGLATYTFGADAPRRVEATAATLREALRGASDHVE
ncbi:hypothetical protein [Lentzea sp. NBRC 102530]|uniref:hypothetical protein n=1 Tax=Lentzea sp. NBRC 102530 TaxID=3032201 RepID=UPI0024A47058|nr:hypothetical protein [Lentzea sp. NBRC 102530]GLY50956.1 hypothetical protein Lesp01_46120 [Lentzea sp. NBRC 102530]